MKSKGQIPFRFFILSLKSYSVSSCLPIWQFWQKRSFKKMLYEKDLQLNLLGFQILLSLVYLLSLNFINRDSLFTGRKLLRNIMHLYGILKFFTWQQKGCAMCQWCLTYFMSLVSFYTSWKHQKNRGFMMFSKGI